MTQYSQLARDLQGAAIQFTALASSASAFGSVVNTFREFERQLTLTASAANATAVEFRRMEEASKRFSLFLTGTAAEGAQALYELASAGFDANESLSAMSGVMLLAQANLEEVGFAADVVSANIRAFGLSASDATRVANVFTAANINSLATLDKLAYSLRQVAPVAAVAGLSIEETVGYLSELYNIGLRGEQAGTGLRNIIVRLSAPVGEAREILSEFGIATVDAAGNMRNLEEVLRDISAQNFSTEQLSKLFGAEALASGVALLESVNGSYQKLRDEITGTNAAFEVASKQVNTLDGSLRIAQNSINSIAISMGDALSPAIRDLALMLSEIARWFDQLDTGSQAAIATFGSFAVAAVALIAAFGTLVPLLANGVKNIISLGGGLVGVVRSLPAAVAGISALGATLTSMGATVVSIVANWQLFAGGFLAIVGLPAILATAAAAVVGLGAAWLIVANNARAAEEAQRGAATIDAQLPDQRIQDFADNIDAARQKLRAIPNIFANEGTGPVDAAGAAVGTIENIKKTLEDVMRERADLMKTFEDSVKERDAQDKKINDFYESGAATPGNYIAEAFGSLFGTGSPLDRLSDFQKGQLAEYDSKISELQKQSDQIDAIVKEATEIVVESFTKFAENIEDDPTLLSPNLGPLENKVKELLNNDEFYATLLDAVKQTAADGKVSTAEVQDTVIRVFSERDADIAKALAPATSLAKTLASLSAGQTSFRNEIRKVEVAISKREADAMSDLAAAYEADVLAASLELRDDLENFQQDAAKVIADALGSNELISAVFQIVDAQGETTTAALTDLINRNNIFEALKKEAANGASLSEMEDTAKRLGDRNRELLDILIAQLVEAGRISEETANQLREQFELSGAAIAAAIDGFSVSLLESEEENEKRMRQAVTAAKRQADLVKQLADLRIDSQLTLLNAQQRMADLGTFNASEDLQRGFQRLDLEYEKTLAGVKARIDAESAALGRELTEEERSAIYNRYADAAATVRAAGQEQLIRELRETSIGIERELDDVSTRLADASREAKQTLLQQGSSLSVADFLQADQENEVNAIVARYRAQITSLAREQQDLQQKYRGNPAMIEAVNAEYHELIQTLQQAMQAELKYTDTFEAQAERRVRAIDKQISQMREQALVSGDVTAQISAGINEALLEAQKSSLNVIDVTRDAITGLIDVTSEGLTDVIFDFGNAGKNLADNLNSLARDLSNAVIKDALEKVLSGFMSPEAQAAANGGHMATVDPNSVVYMANTIADAIRTTITPMVTQAGLNATGGTFGGPQVTLPQDITAAIKKAADAQGVSADTLTRIAYIESRGNPYAKNPNSSAGGLFQFVDSTAAQYGLKDRYDVTEASNAAARLLADNIRVLSSVLGRMPTAGEAYLAHQQGAGGASRLLSNPMGRAVDTVGYKAVINNGGNASMTNAEFAAMWTQKVDGIVTPSITGASEAVSSAMKEGATKIAEGAGQASEAIRGSATKMKATTTKAETDFTGAFDTLIMGIGSVGGQFLGEFGSVLGSLLGVLSGGDGLSNNIGNIFSSLFGGGAKSFAGGGFTGFGSRTGGLDGKGGYLALVHPNESIIDHTMPRIVDPNAGRSNSGGSTFVQPLTVNVNDYNGNKVRVEEEQRSDGRRLNITIEEQVSGAITRPGSQAKKSLSNTFGLQERITQR